MVEAAEIGMHRIERAFAGVAEGRMAEIVGERQRLGQILVEPERAGERAGDLRHLQRVGQAGAVMIALVIHEYLGFVLQPAERGGMDDAVAVAAKRAAGGARRLGEQPPAACAGSEA